MKYRTLKKAALPPPPPPPPTDFNKLDLRDQICVAYRLCVDHYFSLEDLNGLLKSLSLTPFKDYDYEGEQRVRKMFDALVRADGNQTRLLDALRSSDAFAKVYEALIAKYQPEWDNFNCTAWQSRDTEYYAKLRVMHCILFDQLDDWEHYTDDSDEDRHDAKLRQLGLLENKSELLFSPLASVYHQNFPPAVLFKLYAIQFRELDYGINEERRKLVSFLEANQEPLNAHWIEAFNILADDILSGTWTFCELMKSKVHLDEQGKTFLRLAEAFRDKTLPNAREDAEKLVRFLMANGEQFDAKRLSHYSLVVILMAAAWTRLDEALQNQLVEFLKDCNDDGVYTVYSYSYPNQGLADYYDAFWKASCGKKVPGGHGMSWDNLGFCSKVIRLLNLSALPSKFKSEDHLDKGLSFIEHFDTVLPQLHSWCARQFTVLPSFQFGRFLKEKMDKLAKDDKANQQANPQWYAPEAPSSNDANEELASTIRRILGISKAAQARKTPAAETSVASKRIAWVVALEDRKAGYSQVVDIIPRQYVFKRGVWSIESGMTKSSLGGRTAYDLIPEEEQLFHGLSRFVEGSYGYARTRLNEENARLLTKVRFAFITDEEYVDDGRISDDAKILPAVFELKQLPVNVKEEKNGALTIALPACDYSTSFPVQKLPGGKCSIMRIDKATRELSTLFKSVSSTSTLTLAPEVVRLIPGLFEALGKRYQLDAHLSQDTLKQLPTVKGQVALLLRIHVQGDAYQLNLLNRPIAGEKLVLVPGAGAAQITSTVAGQSTIVLRNLTDEAARRDEFLKAMPDLECWESEPCAWTVTGTDEMLALLEKLTALNRQNETPEEQLCQLEWDNSKPFHVCPALAWKNIAFTKDATSKGWFDMGSEVPVDDGKVVQMQQLFECVNKASGNFIKLDDETYIRLTGLMKRQLQALEFFAQKSGSKIKLPPAALPLLGAFYTSDGECPAALKTTLKTMEKNLKAKPQVPSGLRAELRPYQLDGFVWMRRLAQCGLGCCLADDMGIGKTVQALALLLDLAQDGPSLVVVPASLLAHWYNECQRFTPELVPMVYGGTAEERSALLASAKASTLVIATYGCLQGDIEDFNGRDWNCVILDEAQSIKNRETKRSRAAKSLRCKFRLALSGTPVENNLMELWSIFDFLNPGMLGSEKQFQEKMDSCGDKVSPALKRAISPLMLRRTKAEVLAELPEKTEITMNIELPTENREQYEALRRNAKQLLAGPLANTSRVKVLAQLTKLRCFCCAPELAGIDNGSSPKLDMLMNLATELNRAGHRTLVFSQFVKFLDLVRARFDKENLKYSYLDGSTPAQQRSKIVDEFNHGKNAFFLISLKAGGLGLNLSSADFVILLDAWWNPAVENQAIDRAHRIGQTHPVTVYRMVCNDTVEEKILELHQKKRFIAEEIFDENQTSSLKLEELLNLI